MALGPRDARRLCWPCVTKSPEWWRCTNKSGVEASLAARLVALHHRARRRAAARGAFGVAGPTSSASRRSPPRLWWRCTTGPGVEAPRAARLVALHHRAGRRGAARRAFGGAGPTQRANEAPRGAFGGAAPTSPASRRSPRRVWWRRANAAGDGAPRVWPRGAQDAAPRGSVAGRRLSRWCRSPQTGWRSGCRCRLPGPKARHDRRSHRDHQDHRGHRPARRPRR